MTDRKPEDFQVSRPSFVKAVEDIQWKVFAKFEEDQGTAEAHQKLLQHLWDTDTRGCRTKAAHLVREYMETVKSELLYGKAPAEEEPND